MAQQRAENKRREQQREQQAFLAQEEEEAEKKRQAAAKQRAQLLLENKRREADEAQQRELDEKRKRLEMLPKEVRGLRRLRGGPRMHTLTDARGTGLDKQVQAVLVCESVSAARDPRNRGCVCRLGPRQLGRL